MDLVEVALVVVVGLPTLASLVYGFWRDAHRSDEDRQEERAQLRLDNLRLEMQLDSARAEIVRLNWELEHAPPESTRTHGGISVSGGTVNVGNDLTGANKS